MNAEGVLGAPAYAVYRSVNAKRRKSKKCKNKRKNNEEITITEDESCEIEEIGDNCLPSTSFAKTNKKKRTKNYDILKTKNKEHVEVIELDENSDDTLTENEKRKKKKRRSNTHGDGIFAYVDKSEFNGSPTREITFKNGKKKSKNHISSRDAEIFIVNSESDDSENEEEDEDDDPNTGDSLVEGRKLFVWLISPVVPEDFFRYAIKPHVCLKCVFVTCNVKFWL